MQNGFQVKGTEHKDNTIHTAHLCVHCTYQDTFTTTAQAALEMGAVHWARGLVDHQFSHYVRLDGMIHYRGEVREFTMKLRSLRIHYRGMIQ